MQGGEVFVPRDPEHAGDRHRRRDRPRRADARSIGIRPGEKIHEVLLTAEEARHAAGFDDYFAIYPSFPFWRTAEFPAGDELPPGFVYSSDGNDRWVGEQELRDMVAGIAPVA